jgi:hypothetical protein
MKRKAALDGGQIAFAVLNDETNDDVIERRHHLWPCPTSELAGILIQTDIPPILQPIFNAPLPPRDRE